MIHVYVDISSRSVREAFCRALGSEPQFDTRCDLIDKCAVALRDLQHRYPPYPGPFTIPTVALVSNLDAAGPALLRQRYRGLLGDHDDLATLAQALRAVAGGEVWASRQLLSRIISDETPSLTEREQQVLRALTHGLSNRDIATDLGISVRTVKAYVSSLLAKHESSSRVELILRYGNPR